jgi:hypothetical protein
MVSGAFLVWVVGTAVWIAVVVGFVWLTRGILRRGSMRRR